MTATIRPGHHLTGYRSTMVTVTRYLAMAGGTLTVIQFVLAGYGAYRAVQHHGHGFDAHGTLGMVIGLVSVLLLIGALVARASGRVVAQAVVLAILAAAGQPLLGGLADDHSAWWGGLHALVGIAILGLYGQLSRKPGAPDAGAGSPSAVREAA